MGGARSLRYAAEGSRRQSSAREATNTESSSVWTFRQATNRFLSNHRTRPIKPSTQISATNYCRWHRPVDAGLIFVSRKIWHNIFTNNSALLVYLKLTQDQRVKTGTLEQAHAQKPNRFGGNDQQRGLDQGRPVGEEPTWLSGPQVPGSNRPAGHWRVT